MKTKPNDMKKRTVLLRKRLSPELEKIVIALELPKRQMILHGLNWLL